MTDPANKTAPKPNSAPNPVPTAPRALWPEYPPTVPNDPVKFHTDVIKWLEHAHPVDMSTLCIRLTPLDVPDAEPMVTPPIARADTDARRANIAAYRRVQTLRYGETLSRLRALVTLNLRGDDVPMTDFVVATGSAESFRAVAKLVGVAEIYPMPEASTVR